MQKRKLEGASTGELIKAWREAHKTWAAAKRTEEMIFQELNKRDVDPLGHLSSDG